MENPEIINKKVLNKGNSKATIGFIPGKGHCAATTIDGLKDE
jgi:hypothetical protein